MTIITSNIARMQLYMRLNLTQSGGYGVKYKFTIDQLSCEIYNEDSLPVHADTIIDKILIKTLTTASGVDYNEGQKRKRFRLKHQ